MRKLPTLFTLLFVCISFAQVGVNTTEPDNSALLDVVSNNKGFLPPRLTTAERNGISNPAEGLTIFNKSANVQCLQVYRNVTNGNGWFDICCPEAVSKLANFSAAAILFTPDKFFTGADGTGGSVADGGEVGSVGPVDLSAFGTAYPSAAFFNQFDGTGNGTGAGNYNIKASLLNNNINDYSASAFLTKDANFDFVSLDKADDLRLDLSGLPVYTGDLTLTVVARYNSLPASNQTAQAFFALGLAGNPGSFQLDNFDANSYFVRAIGGNIVGDVVPSSQAVPIDTNFHLFNVVYQSDVNGSPLVKFYIDGLLQTGTTTSSIEINQIMRLLSNRNNSQNPAASMAYFGLDPVAKTQAEISGLAKGIQCLFDEL